MRTNCGESLYTCHISLHILWWKFVQMSHTFIQIVVKFVQMSHTFIQIVVKVCTDVTYVYTNCGESLYRCRICLYKLCWKFAQMSHKFIQIAVKFVQMSHMFIQIVVNVCTDVTYVYTNCGESLYRCRISIYKLWWKFVQMSQVYSNCRQSLYRCHISLYKLWWKFVHMSHKFTHIVVKVCTDVT